MLREECAEIEKLGNNTRKGKAESRGEKPRARGFGSARLVYTVGAEHVSAAAFVRTTRRPRSVSATVTEKPRDIGVA